MYNKYKLSLVNQTFSLSFIIAMAIGLVFAGISFYSKFEYLGGTPLRIGLALYIAYFLPVVFLHVEYFLIDYKKTLFIDHVDNEFIYTRGQDRQSFKLNDIEKIIIYQDLNGWFSTSAYSFVLIQIRERENPIILTSLLIKKFAKPLPIENEKIFHKRRIIPSPFLERLLALTHS